jgi:hypothetical protein
VDALGHYLEGEGIPTTQISFIREHTETIQPPRALWVPFELGRPLGVARDPAFQHRVLLAALELLEAERGPVLDDFPDEGYDRTSEGDPQQQVWACPINFADQRQEQTISEKLAGEIRELKPWHDLRMERSGRTAMVSFSADSAGRFLGELALGNVPANPLTDVSMAAAIRIAAQDLKAFYFEAVTARPGGDPLSSQAFTRWFWNETMAGRVLFAVKEWCSKQDDKALRLAGAMLLVPLGQQ